MSKVRYNGVDRELAELCRELGIDRRTVASRLERGVTIEVALIRPIRSYPKIRKAPRALPALSAPQREKSEQRKSSERLVADAVDLLVDVREILAALQPTPRRERVLTNVRYWLRSAGWW